DRPVPGHVVALHELHGRDGHGRLQRPHAASAIEGPARGRAMASAPTMIDELMSPTDTKRVARLSVTPGLQALVIVRRDRPYLVERLGRGLPGVGAVILDRRQGERRRQGTSAPGFERRRRTRRQALTRAERELWEQAGYAVVFEYAPLDRAHAPA